jgi:hypothetical protein
MVPSGPNRDGRACSAWAAVFCGGLAVLTAACKAPVPLPLPPAPTPVSGIYYEEELRAAQQVRVEIGNLQETVSADKRQVTVSGSLVNRGTRPTSAVSIRVSGLDLTNRRVISVYGEPSSNTIAAGGGTATFTATLDNRPEVVRYHVEAIAK